VSSAIRPAASSVAPPWSGWAVRRSVRNRRCTDARSRASAESPNTPSAQRNGSRPPSVDQCTVSRASLRWATSAGPTAPRQPTARRIAVKTPARCSGATRAAAYTAPSTWGAGEPFSSSSNVSCSPSPSRRWRTRVRPIRSSCNRWRRRGCGTRWPASSWWVSRSRSSVRSASTSAMNAATTPPSSSPPKPGDGEVGSTVVPRATRRVGAIGRELNTSSSASSTGTRYRHPAAGRLRPRSGAVPGARRRPGRTAPPPRAPRRR
jgi:hypothetical protein